MTDRPLVLVTNDDGVAAQGIRALATAMATVGEVMVCAPAQQQSAVSHKISLGRPLRVHKLDGNRYAVTGTPVDAVFLALSQLHPRRPALVVSGINHGVNIGADIFYSGTVAGANEGAMRDLPAIAVSQQLGAEDVEERSAEHTLGSTTRAQFKMNLEHTARFAAELAKAVLKKPFPPGTVLNVNAPSKPTQVFRWTHMGRKRYRNTMVKRLDPRGVPYYWVGSPEVISEEADGCDHSTVAAGLISVTPLQFDRTLRLKKTPRWDLDGFASHD